MHTTLPEDQIGELAAELRAANVAFARRYPGDAGTRQPVHTVYGGAHLFRADSARKLGSLALRSLEEYAPTAGELAGAVGMAGDVDAVYTRTLAKLRREPVEDFRLDYEDGYGNRPDDEEDAHAEAGAREVAEGARAGSLPPFIGIRVKPLNEELRQRSVRTLDLFVTTLVSSLGGLPDNFIVTLPKITVREQVQFLVRVLDRLERALALRSGALRFEIMVETPQNVIARGGVAALPDLLDAAEGRMSGAHFGTYDYTAGLDITAAQQRMRHRACDFARHVMQVSFAGTGVRLSDGSTTVMPVAVNRTEPDGEPLTAAELDENRAIVHRAWRMHYEDVRYSLAHGFYQGWDLHPAQLPTRYAALFSFFLEGRDAAAARLHNFVGKAAQATLVGDVFDDAATGQGLLNYFLRGINSGAFTEEETASLTGLTIEDLRGRSFVKILARRRAGGEASG